MAALTKNVISVILRDRAKWTFGITSVLKVKQQIFKKNLNFKNKNGSLCKNSISVTVRYRAKRTKIWDHKG